MGDGEHSSQYLAAIVEGSDDAIFSKTLDAVITSWNRGAVAIYGYRPDEIIGKSATILVPEDYPSDIPAIMERIRRGEPVDHYETLRRRKDGQRINVALTVSPIRDSTGKIIGASTIARDITARRLAEEALRGADKLAAMGRMAASIAHEIRSPLDVAKNLTYLLKENPSLNSEARDLLTILDEQLTHALEICSRTLSFSRQNNTASRLSVSATVDEILTLLKTNVVGKSITVDRRFESAGEVIGYPGPLRQVCVNLISNAIDAIPSGQSGRLLVRIRDARHPATGIAGIRLTISDTGSGISSENRSHLFQPFFSTKKEQGTGLGLWVSYGIVHQHGGSIRVRTQTQGACQGTLFSVFLPSLGARQADNENAA